MTEPRRLMDEGADDFEMRLLSAGRRDALSRSSRNRILAGLGLGFLAPTTAVAATGHTAAKGGLFASGYAGAIKVIAGGVVGTVAAVSTWHWVGDDARDEVADRPSQTAPPVAAVRAPETKAVVEVSAETKPETHEPPSTQPAVDVVPAKQAVRPSPKPSDLGLEIASLEEARSALRRGDSRQSLELLDRHRREFPRARMGAEATVLRIEALKAGGNDAAARRIGQAFLAKHKDGPYAKRVRTLMDTASEVP